jgi:capsular polysaccharide biosynthesis protein
MEEQNTPPNPTPTKSGFSPLTIRNLIPGIVVGILIGIAGFLVYDLLLLCF